MKKRYSKLGNIYSSQNFYITCSWCHPRPQSYYSDDASLQLGLDSETKKSSVLNLVFKIENKRVPIFLIKGSARQSLKNEFETGIF